jgi:hypothetical protein
MNSARAISWQTASPTIRRSNPIRASSSTNDLPRHQYRDLRHQPASSYGALIAAQARRRGATLVTANGREFARVPGLMVTDWTA